MKSAGMIRWKERVALVTGASAGIGAATVERLVSEGMRVVACARRLERLQEICDRIDGAAERTLPFAVDLRSETAIGGLFDAVRERWGGVDVLINNAGLGHEAPLLSADTALWREMFEVNVLALCVCTREAVSDMRRRGDDGHVIHVSSMAAHRVPGGSGVYSATKYAVRSLTEALRLELREAGSDIRVSALSPGFVETEFAAHYHKSEAKAKDVYSRFKTLEAADMADAIAYVLSTPKHVQIHDLLVRPTHQPN